MSDRLGPVSYKMSDEDPFLGREIHQNRQFSEHTMEVIDDEVTKILQDAAQKSLNMLGDRREQLKNLTEQLIEREELDQKEIRELIGASVHDERLEAKNELANQENSPPSITDDQASEQTAEETETEAT